jgi:2-polyprenyl-6-methoxyphenol hydroxylase-like FAD-dependent oxidoreductase
VLFAGDAAHLVPIFGVRGLNSGLDDAANLAWKLAMVLEGGAGDACSTYSVERVHAARENIAYGAKSTEFMAPPDFAFSPDARGDVAARARRAARALADQPAPGCRCQLQLPLPLLLKRLLTWIPVRWRRVARD